jgi:mRNA-degrading endonuclease toxin of MazEF toxin-antitoxin module
MPPLPRQGQFWWISDEAIAFPENRDRESHPTRGCIVIEGDESLARGGARVLVVPTSSQTDRKDVYDVVIPHPPAPNYECVALVEHVQPVLRSDLTNLVARLPDPWPDRVLAAVLAVFGVVPEPEPDPQADDIPF